MSSRGRRRFGIAVLLLAILAVGACGAPGLSLQQRLVDPRLSQAPLPADRFALEQALGLRDLRFRTRAGLALSYTFVEPARYGLRVEVERGAHSRFHFTASAPQAPAMKARGSVLMLHGWGMDRSSLYPWALHLAEQGYRVLLVDLRSHGRSADAPPGYGRHEAADLAELLDALDADSSLPGPLHLLGVSYGGASAAHLLALRPQRFAGVLLMEPFANAGEAIRDMVPALLQAEDAPLWRRPLLALLSLQYSPQRVETAIAASSAQLGIELDDVELAPLLSASPACIALLHGRRDRHVRVEHARSLAGAVPAIRFSELPHEDHLSLPLRLDWLGTPIAAWLRDSEQAQAAELACPQLALPVDPLLASAPPQPAPLRLQDVHFGLAAQ